MRVGWALLLLLLAGCQSEPAAIPEMPSACQQRSFEGSRFTVCDPSGGRIELVAAAASESPSRGFAHLQAKLGPRAADVAFAMNAGMYDEDGRPIGLAIVEGKQVHAVNRNKGGGNFHLMPNGVFQLRDNGQAEIVPTEQWKPSPSVRIATQSGPMLVIDGKLHPDFAHDGTSKYVRNGVGIAPDGRPLFVISDDEVSFGKFARFFRDELGSRNALFLDGAVSSLWDPANHRMDAGYELGPMVVEFRPSAESARRP